MGITRYRVGADTSQVLCFHRCMPNEAKPTVKQVYAIAAALCKETGEKFPQSRGDALELINKLRGEPASGREE